MNAHHRHSSQPNRRRAKAIAISGAQQKAHLTLMLASGLLLSLLLLGAGRLIGP